MNPLKLISILFFIPNVIIEQIHHIPRICPRNKILCGSAGVLLLFYLTAYLLPLSARPMVRPDEFRYAEIPREMIERGDWVAPRLLDFRYFEKPALGYQLTALSFRLLGENRFALRLPSALATGLTAALIFVLLMWRSSNPWLPGLAGGIYLTFGLVFGIGTFAVLDSQLNAALTAAFVLFYLAHTSSSSLARMGFMGAAGLAAGIAFLIKGFLGFVVPLIVILPFILLQRRFRQTLQDAWIFIGAAVLITLPWSLWIHMREADFWRYFIEVEHIQRFTSRTHDKSPEHALFFIPILLAGILPSGLLFGLSKNARWRILLQRPIIRYALCWFAFPFVFFSLSSCKLGTYILPCFPAIAILLAFVTWESLRRAPENFRALARTAGVCIVFLGVASWPVWYMCRHYLESALYPNLAILSLILWGIALSRQKRFRVSVVLTIFLFGMAPAVYFSFHSISATLNARKMPENLLKQCIENLALQPDDVIYVDRSAMQAAAWMLKRSDLNVLGNPGEIYYAVQTYPEYQARHIKTWEDLALNHSVGKRVYIALGHESIRQIPNDIPIIHGNISKNIAYFRF